ncbi:hypothetical protein SAMN04488546_3506 [Geodermatophilus poikilotrophus]|uniref:Uncharacterized protein n=1 Tax=Geodermatophilus poikilotrophus TaxID=1333667 RepID=A0A1I0GSD3_9ACTN|nr:hypothetical protein SAMN04488546_3506 [Geodermatophilus poikilotrophus]
MTDPSATGRDRVAPRPEPVAATEDEEDGR